MWVKVDDAFPEHRKVLEAGAHLGRNGPGRVIAIWMVGIAFCNRNLTDGYLTDGVVRSFKVYDKAPFTVAEAMCLQLRDGSNGLLTRADRGFLYHDYGIYQPLAKDIKARRDWDTKRKQLYAVPGLVEAIRARDQNCCRYCGGLVNWRDRKSGIGGTYDHVIPRGDNTLDNVVVACYGCNVRKGSRTPEQAGMPLLPPPPDGSGSSSRTRSDQVRNPARPDPDPVLEKKDQGRATLGHCGNPVENRKVLKALIWREIEAALTDPDEELTIANLSERVKACAARAGLIYSVDGFAAEIEIAFQRLARPWRYA